MMHRMREDAARPLDRKMKVYRAKYFTIISTTACSLELAFSIDSCKLLAYENPQPVAYYRLSRILTFFSSTSSAAVQKIEGARDFAIRDHAFNPQS